ncbi:uncharacterized protein ACBT57_002692 isoform 3-T14 [Dama dama]|uniref:uncharacterized protein LOC133046082 isoform X3 n=1 Tax=Dama dama TaxID=30532 RepID=UPI002A365AD1|nr:uncharacterized protein LOC133046082 isoform X3 [Dama dama]
MSLPVLPGDSTPGQTDTHQLSNGVDESPLEETVAQLTAASPTSRSFPSVLRLCTPKVPLAPGPSDLTCCFWNRPDSEPSRAGPTCITGIGASTVLPGPRYTGGAQEMLNERSHGITFDGQDAAGLSAGGLETHLVWLEGDGAQRL